MTKAQNNLEFLIRSHIENIYPDENAQTLVKRLISIMQLENSKNEIDPYTNKWSEQDTWVITYGDSIKSEDEKPLATLHRFMSEKLLGVINGVHILPFFPYSSDDGFAVIDYTQVNDSLGDWQHIEQIAKDFHLMADLVVNHCSSRSRWFENFKQRKESWEKFFLRSFPG